MTLNDKLAQFFRAHPNTWLDGRHLAQVAGYAGFRNRITDLRLQRGFTIDNRVRRVRGAIGMMTLSEYCYQPAVAPQPVWACSCTADSVCGYCDGPDREASV